MSTDKGYGTDLKGVELSVTKIISQSFNLYLTRFFHFFLPFLMVGLVNGVFSIVVSTYLPLPPPPGINAPPEALLEWLPSFFSALIAMLALNGVVAWIVGTMANGVAVKYTSDMFEKGKASLQEGVSFTISRVASLLAVGIITSILMIFGLICFIVPGIIIAIMYSLVVPVIIIERVGAVNSLGRSKRLVDKRWGKIFATFLIIGIIIVIMILVASFTGIRLGPVNSIITSTIIALFQPLLPIATTFLYYSMVAKEAQLAPRPPPPPSIPVALMKFCPHCGLRIPPDALFCPFCGKEIRSIE